MKYFLKLLKSYPKKTTVVIGVLSVISFIKLVTIDGIGIFISLSAVVGFILMLLILKVWLVAVIEDSILISNSSNSVLSLLLLTVLVMMFATMFTAPLLNHYIPAG